MSIHHIVDTPKVGKVEFYLNPEYVFSTEQMWIMLYVKGDGKKYRRRYFFHRNYKISEIKEEIVKMFS